ncbi:hypothetical protein D9619_010562 [Psilocybe cf. subviscida]|uniref:Cytochrome P450 n=1 Tax=Psilocybe cf. subviscida TaxID=2480587 RepID=A0A8H5ASQ5_9AGAR|nr:hypothetical protein D9619_010562 [Psilocybe cf. subviscida]
MGFIPRLLDDWTFTNFFVGGLGVLCLISALTAFQSRKIGIPGPTGLPIIGNAHQMPSYRPWLVFSAWKRLYGYQGNIIYLDVLGKPIIVVNSAKIAQDLMDKRSSIYSDRPISVMAELCGYYNTFGMAPYGDEWRKQRRLVVHDFSPSMTPRYYGLQETAARTLVRNLVTKPESLRSEVKLRIGMIILRVAYGYKVESIADPILQTGLLVVESFSLATAPGRWLVEIIPALKHLPRWFPGAGFRRQADEWKDLHVKGSHDPYYWCKENLETGKALSPSLCGRLIEEAGRNISEMDEFSLHWAAASVFGGGLDTVRLLVILSYSRLRVPAQNMAAVLTFFRAMILNPHVVAKAQEEIDRVVGRDRLPSIKDKPDLPYVRSVAAEILRYAPSIPLGIPHTVTKDDYYDGYFIPKGTIVFPNIWHMTHDPEIYPNPDKFDPDRFKGQDSEMSKVYDLVFGFGRRVCPGLHLAQATLFAIVATTLATCEVLPGLDENGREVLPTTGYENGTIPMTEPYSLRMKPRSPQAASLLAEASTEIE